MALYPLVLFLHLVAVVAVFALPMFIHIGLDRLWKAQSALEARDALHLASHGARLVPWAGLALLLTGGYLTQVAWSWTTGWIDVSIVGWLAITVLGHMIGGRMKALGPRLGSAAMEGGRPLDTDLAAALRQRFIRTANYVPALLALAVMLVMVTKPSASWGVLELIVAAILGVLAGGRQPRPLAAAERAGLAEN